jgi:hypothetical protein
MCAVCGEPIVLDALDRVWQHVAQPEFHAAITGSATMDMACGKHPTENFFTCQYCTEV